MLPRVLASSCLAFTVCAVALDARAEDAVAFSWNAPPGCPSEADVVRAIGDVVGRSERAEPLRARAVVGRKGEAWHAEVALSRGGVTNERAVDGDSCASVANAVTLIVALAAKKADAEPARESPARVAPAPPSASSSAEAAPASDEADEADERDVPPAPAGPRRPFYAGASVLVDTAMLPTADAGPEVVFGWRPRHFRLEIGGAFLPPVRATAAARPPEGADISLVHAGARGCWTPIEGTFEIGPCAGGGVDVVSAPGSGVRTPATPVGAIATSSLGAMASARLSDLFALRVDAGALVPLTRPTFTIDAPNGAALVHRVPLASLRASAGVELRFP